MAPETLRAGDDRISSTNLIYSIYIYICTLAKTPLSTQLQANLSIRTPETSKTTPPRRCSVLHTCFFLGHSTAVTVNSTSDSGRSPTGPKASGARGARSGARGVRHDRASHVRVGSEGSSVGGGIGRVGSPGGCTCCCNMFSCSNGVVSNMNPMTDELNMESKRDTTLDSAIYPGLRVHGAPVVPCLSCFRGSHFLYIGYDSDIGSRSKGDGNCTPIVAFDRFCFFKKLRIPMMNEVPDEMKFHRFTVLHTWRQTRCLQHGYDMI